ncbi:substrate-binding periplasmic protein [Roseateles toxinivorans]|uniref:Amino acid ABC transporter substrate-binding protein (PAAT family) n=1 Tax=Roseateles toxinivorans TaxID=270368 RepID=A0A4R6QS09_9BURK|nr:transporter substrate-binding domain-containing protein [Roseateles toxinivorans]TDP74101.1 amino acid ABC transporter substrate-binding protein (PAAT family) [Roseateles toxinivorans]
MLRLLLQSLLLCVPALVMAETRPVTIAFDDAYPPYCYVESGRSMGAYILLMRRAAQALPGWEVKLLPLPWARAVQEAELGKVDAFMPPYRGVGRSWVGLYAGPVNREEIVLSCRPSTQLGPASHWPQDFVGKRIGVMRGSLLSQALVDAFKQGQVLRREFRLTRDALTALASDQIDCYANDKLSIELAHAQALGDSLWASRVPAQLEPPFVLSVQPAYIGFSQQSLLNRPELAEFARALDAQLAQMRASGELARLMAQLAARADD